MAGSAWTNQLQNLIILAAQSGGFSGFFAYSPAPGAGNLIVSLTAEALTDPYLNAVPAGGLTSYSNDGAFWSAVNIGNGVVNWYEAAGPAGPWTLEADVGFQFAGGNGGITLGGVLQPAWSTSGTPLVVGGLTTPPDADGTLASATNVINEMKALLQAQGAWP
jgi:hypothetical protein